MIQVKNKVFDVDVKHILEELRIYCGTHLHKNIFNSINDKNTDNIMVTCPFHGNGSERRPSCGVLKIGEPTKVGTFHCFACHYTATLTEAISNMLGYEDKGKKGEEWLEKNFGGQLSEERQKLYLNLERSAKNSIKTFVSEEELDKYRFYHNYMFERKLTKEIIEYFDVGYDKETKTLTFPVNDENGNCVFITRRSVNSKYFYIPTNVDKPIYGLDKIIKNNIKEVIVCESQINCLTCWVYEKPAIALFGTGSKKQYEILKNSGIRHYVLGFDGDNAGDIGKERFIKEIGNGVIVSTFKIPRGKDINDLTKEEFDSLEIIKMNIHRG